MKTSIVPHCNCITLIAMILLICILFVNIMCTQSQEEIVQLACFVSSMFKLRYCCLYSV